MHGVGALAKDGPAGMNKCTIGKDLLLICDRSMLYMQFNSVSVTGCIFASAEGLLNFWHRPP